MPSSSPVIHARLLTIAVATVLALSLTGCQRDSAEEHIRAGDAALKASNLGDAEKNYLEAVKAAPDNPHAHLALGNFYLSQQKPELAQAEFMKALELDPRNAGTHESLGDFYGAQGRPGLAEEQYRAAVALDPARANLRLKLGENLGRQGKSADAEAELRTAVGLAPKNAQAPFALGQLLASLEGREAESESEYARAKALDPNLTIPQAAAAIAPAAGAAPKIKALNKLFLLTKDSPVYENADTNSKVVAQVKKKKYVHVIGLAGSSWLQIKLRNGTVGFIPVATAE
jgi:Tfp pilus assembly protein PilF